MQALRPASSSVQLDRIVARNPQRFIPPAVIGHCKKTHQQVRYGKDNILEHHRKDH